MSILDRKLHAVVAALDKLAAERIPWGKIAWALAVAVVGAWTIGFLAGLLVKVSVGP